MLPAVLPLVLYRVPAGYRLDFATPAGYFARVFRQTKQNTWDCLARHACNPYLDVAPPATTATYYVAYFDASDTQRGQTPLVTAPARPDLVSCS